MEYIVVIVVIIIGGLFYLGGKFANFKSQLMNELGQRGMDFQSADNLYTVMADEINQLHQDGVSVSVIVDKIIQTGSDESSIANSIIDYNSFEEWLEDFKIECDRTKAGVSPFLEFMDTSNLQNAYEAGKDPKNIAYHFAKDFDPMNIS
ncbi:hypothetical protein N9A39_09175 [Planktomarina temperata]|nr:hypothetical protein [Planktomarina temperata]MDA7483630.1 hypothetical protein [Planktomarina temperata]